MPSAADKNYDSAEEERNSDSEPPKKKAKVTKTWTKDEVMEKLSTIEKNEKKNDKDVKKATLRLQTLQTQLLRMNMEKDRLHAILEDLK